MKFKVGRLKRSSRPGQSRLGAHESLRAREAAESLLNNESYSPPRPMARAKISAMTPMTMTGKNFSGSSDRIWAATASASETERHGVEQKTAACKLRQRGTEGSAARCPFPQFSPKKSVLKKGRRPGAHAPEAQPTLSDAGPCLSILS